MLNDPISQCPLKSNVATSLFRFDPLVLQNLLALCLKFPVERRVLQQVIRRKWHFRFFRHNRNTQIILRVQSYIRLLTNDNLIL